MRYQGALTQLVVVAVVALCLGLFAGAEVFAQEGPCAGDVMKFCKNVPQGEGRIVECLKGNEANLSYGCKMHMAQVKEAVKEAHQACEQDIYMYCAGVPTGGGRIMECLKANERRLSRGCKVKLFEVKQETK